MPRFRIDNQSPSDRLYSTVAGLMNVAAGEVQEIESVAWPTIYSGVEVTEVTDQAPAIEEAPKAAKGKKAS